MPVRRADHEAIWRAGLAIQAEKGGFPASHEVAAALGLCARTVMRALTPLEAAGLVRRYRTGARYLDPAGEAGPRAASEIRVRTEVARELRELLARYPQHRFSEHPTAWNLREDVRRFAAGLKGEK